MEDDVVQLNERSIYTTAEAAKILKLSPVTVERQIRRGELKAIRLGKEYRLLGRDLLALFDWRTFAQSAWQEGTGHRAGCARCHRSGACGKAGLAGSEAGGRLLHQVEEGMIADKIV